MVKKNTFRAITIIIFSILFSSCDAKDSENKTTNIPEKPLKAIMQAGGYSNISNEHLKDLLAENVLLVDIRREEEWRNTGIVKGSKTITFFDRRGNINPNFIAELNAITTPEQEIMLICHTGGRTKAVSEALVNQLGYKNVMNVTNGITGWIAEKRPVSQYDSRSKQ